MADPRPGQHRASHVFNVVMLVFGAAMLTWFLRGVAWGDLSSAIAGVGRRFAIIVALDLAAVLLDARALHAFMRPEARMISYWRVVAAQLSGRAVNVVTPLSALGEATKLTMLVTHAPRVRVVSAIVLANLVSLYWSVAIMVIGTPITLLLVDLPHSLQVAVAIGLAVVIALVGALGVLVERGATAVLTSLLHRVHLISRERRDSWQARLQELDRQLAGLHDQRAAGTWRGLLWLVASRLVGWISLLMLIDAIGVTITARLVAGVLSVGVLIQWIASVVPFGLGIADTGNYVLYDVLGASGVHGALVTMLNRARSLAVAVVGLAVMAVVHTLNRLAVARMHARLRDRRAQLRAPSG
jgi:uncharacterized membrane protein YbhN (UPF0104 family)